MAKSDFFLAFNEITESHHLQKEVVIDALKQALVSAYRRDSNPSPAQRVEAEVDLNASRYRVFVEKEVIDDGEKLLNVHTEISLSDARALDPNIAVGDMIMAPEETNTKDFGRIAAQTAKQVILQKIREAERKTLFSEFKNREGELITATVQSASGQHVSLSLNNGRAEAVMPGGHQIRGERYRPQEKVRVVILQVSDSNKGPQIIVSRADRLMLRRLLEFEVPEIYNGQVEIRSIAREPGQRSKVAVAALQPGIDPVGACVGMRGGRIQNIVKELNDEKIDVIEWNNDPAIFIAKALSPAHTNHNNVYLEDDIDLGATATVIVPDDQLSLAIGREGQNARLAAKLTGWRVDIKSVTEAAFEAQAKLNEPPLNKLLTEQAELITEVNRILEKKQASRTVMPEEFQTLQRFVHIAELRLLEMREAERIRRRKQIDKIKNSLPKRAFTMKLEELEIEKDIILALRNRNITNVGDLMARLQAEESYVRGILESGKAGEDAFEAVKDAIATLAPQADESDVVLEAAVEVEPVVAALSEAAPATASVPEPESADEDAPPAFVDVDAPKKPAAAPVPRAPVVSRVPKAQPPTSPEAVPDMTMAAIEGEDTGDRDDSDSARKDGKKKKGKKGSRELVFDEDRGEVVVKRKHKRGRGDWDDFDE